MLAHEHVIESRCDELARMLAVDKPAGTVIQFRFSSGPDPGNAIIAHLEACGDPSLLHPEAARLHGMNIDFYAMRADAHSYRRQALSLWARVPTRQKGDDANSGLSAFLPAALDEIGKHGVTKLPQSIRASWAETVTMVLCGDFSETNARRVRGQRRSFALSSANARCRCDASAGKSCGRRYIWVTGRMRDAFLYFLMFRASTFVIISAAKP